MRSNCGIEQGIPHACGETESPHSAAENQAPDRAHRIGQTKPVFVHKLVCTGTLEERILELQKHKSALVEALLSEETSKLKIDSETLSHLLAPVG